MQQWHERGVAHYNAKRYEKALHAYAQAFALHALSTLIYEQADCLEKLQRFAEAADMYQRYLDNGPLTADILPVRSRIKKLRGEQIPVGEDDDEPPIAAKGEDGARAWFDRAQEKFVAKRYAQAAECFRQAFALVPLPEFIYDEASALEKGGHPAAAANAYKHARRRRRTRSGGPGHRPRRALPDHQRRCRRRQGGRREGQDPARPGAAGRARRADRPRGRDGGGAGGGAKGKQGASEWHTRGQVAYLVGDYRRAYDAFVAADHRAPAQGLGGRRPQDAVARRVTALTRAAARMPDGTRDRMIVD